MEERIVARTNFSTAKQEEKQKESGSY